MSAALALSNDRNIPANQRDVADLEITFRTPGTYSIDGRYALLCTTTSLSERGLALSVMIKPKVGDRIDAVFDIIGRIRGHVAEITRQGFVMALDADIYGRLREQVAFLANSPDDAAERRHFRLQPRNPETTFRTDDCASHPASVIDFSLSGACIETDVALAPGDAIVFPRLTQARIVRALGNRRFGVEFERPFLPHEFTWLTRL